METATKQPCECSRLAPNKSAYIHYSRGQRKVLVKAHPSWSVQQISSELGRQWKALTETERKPWVELAQFEKVRFRAEAHQHICQLHMEKPVQLRIKRKKLPNEPRRPDTAYICFWRSRRPVVLAANPLLTAQLVSKEIAMQWRALSDSERKVWQNMATNEQGRFQEEIAHFRSTSIAIPKILSAPIKDPFAPKPAKSGFQLFVNHNREKLMLADMTMSEYRAEMSKVWKSLSDADKNEWYELAKQDKWRYEREVNAYKPPVYMDSEIQRLHKRVDELKHIARGDPAAPRLPKNAYNVYLSTERQKLAHQRPDLKNPQIMHELGAAWKLLEKDKRALYQWKAENDLVRFRMEMEAYLARQHYDQQSYGHLNKKRAKKGKEKTILKRKLQQPQAKQQEERSVQNEINEAGAGKNKHKSAPPRRPKTAYNIMFLSKRIELLATNQLSHNECSALCGRLWRQMSEEEREPYTCMAVEDKRRYDVEMEIYNAIPKDGNDNRLLDVARYFRETKCLNSKAVSK